MTQFKPGDKVMLKPEFFQRLASAGRLSRSGIDFRVIPYCNNLIFTVSDKFVSSNSVICMDDLHNMYYFESHELDSYISISQLGKYFYLDLFQINNTTDVNSCVHNYVDYVGLNETYQYCTLCNNKK